VASERPSPRLAYVIGARPNIVKMLPVIEGMRAALPRARHVVVHTGQHYDREMSEVFFEELGLGEPDVLLGVGSGPHGRQTGRALECLEEVFVREEPDAVVVAGDVNSTLAGALAAVKLQIPVAHVESGLRSFDRTMPEEINRVLVDQISSWCFTHSPEAAQNLRREGIGDERIFFVGNTMIDTLERMAPRLDETDILARLSLGPRRYVLVTLHRPSLVDGPLLERVLAGLGELGRSFPTVFPVHPRTRSRLAGWSPPPGVTLTEPLGYLDFLALERDAAAVLTDSGGVQEETTSLGVPCFTLRSSTERPVTLSEGTNMLLGLRPERIAEIPQLLLRHVPRRPDGWDGRAGERLCEALVAALAGQEPRRAESAAGQAV
jgi:UDP-N-acetylglucosamine 2-epimerase (non-hydrolysing)